MIHGHFGSEITQRRLQQQSQAVGTLCENSPGVVCLLFHGLRYQIHHSNVTPPPPALTLQQSASVLAVPICLSDCLSLLRPLLLHLSVCFLYHFFLRCNLFDSMAGSLISFFLLLSFHLCQVCLSVSELLLEPGYRVSQQKLPLKDYS